MFAGYSAAALLAILFAIPFALRVLIHKETGRWSNFPQAFYHAHLELFLGNGCLGKLEFSNKPSPLTGELWREFCPELSHSFSRCRCDDAPGLDSRTIRVCMPPVLLSPSDGTAAHNSGPHTCYHVSTIFAERVPWRDHQLPARSVGTNHLSEEGQY